MEMKDGGKKEIISHWIQTAISTTLTHDLNVPRPLKNPTDSADPFPKIYCSFQKD